MISLLLKHGVGVAWDMASKEARSFDEASDLGDGQL